MERGDSSSVFKLIFCWVGGGGGGGGGGWIHWREGNRLQLGGMQ